MEIKTDDYRIWTEDSTIHFEGTMRLSGMEAYEPILNLMDEVIEKKPAQVDLNLLELEFLNSSGINLLARFVIKVRKLGSVGIAVKGSKRIPWQSKSLPNLTRLHPNLTLTVV